MRTTVTLDDETESLIRQAMDERGVSFKTALNEAVRAGLADLRPVKSEQRTRSRSMGPPAVDLDHALRIAADLEDAELLRRMSVGQ